MRAPLLVRRLSVPAVLVLALASAASSPSLTETSADRTAATAAATVPAAATTSPGLPDAIRVPATDGAGRTETALDSAAVGRLLTAYRTAVAAAPASCHLTASLLAAVDVVDGGGTLDPVASAAGARALGARLCQGGRDLATRSGLRAALRATQHPAAEQQLVRTYQQRYARLGMDEPVDPGLLRSPQLDLVARQVGADVVLPAATAAAAAARTSTSGHSHSHSHSGDTSVDSSGGSSGTNRPSTHATSSTPASTSGTPATSTPRPGSSPTQPSPSPTAEPGGTDPTTAPTCPPAGTPTADPTGSLTGSPTAVPTSVSGGTSASTGAGDATACPACSPTDGATPAAPSPDPATSGDAACESTATAAPSPSSAP